ERFDSVHALCQQQGFKTVRRSSAQAVTPDVAVLMGDTMGELLFLYALADIAFVGGSLVPNGGHNLLEPAALAKPLLSGPHLFNFLEIAAMLRTAGALQEVGDATALAAALQHLIAHPQEARSMADAGLAVMKANQGALQRLLDGIGRLMARR
ncbi:3-deoxy-D-manno-octulosonic-acid transferase, partial [Pseudomonas syringae pv. actinidiae ICMP 19101]